MSKKKQLVNTLGEMANRYGYSLRTLKSLINTYPDLVELLKPFREKKAVVFPQSVIDAIKDKLGEC